jgi:hypothetical protein
MVALFNVFARQLWQNVIGLVMYRGVTTAVFTEFLNFVSKRSPTHLMLQAQHNHFLCEMYQQLPPSTHLTKTGPSLGCTVTVMYPGDIKMMASLSRYLFWSCDSVA